MKPPSVVAIGATQAVVDRATDLIGTLSAADVTPADVAVVLREHGEPDPAPTPEDVASLRAAAAELRSVLAADTVDLAAERVNALLARTAYPPRLSNHGGAHRWHLHVDSDDEQAPLAEWFLASTSLVLAQLIGERQRPPGGVCAARGCDRVFVDTAHGSRRRYCSPRCAGRERVAAHRRRAANARG
ncbi:CGNR zinc finger domain-containing protein [Nocardiopsis oceani]